ncbi:MAG: T9SS type A sorting domain-containing protein [Bacteroidetes bacterium]|nr:T9SS type A sorting domain-containing protein [Bacteroidota bacterium]
MKKILVLLALYLAIHGSVYLNGQTPYIKQIITANSGQFEFSPPYQDFVTAQTYNPLTGAGNVIQTVFTQSVQDICIKGNIAYIAAQDSLIMLNLDTYRRIAAIADSGLSKLLVFGDKLIVSKQYPTTTFFAEVLKADDLSLVSSIHGIPGDCGGLVAAGDSIYIAVNGGWMGTEGKIAVVETTGWTLVREINLGTAAVGIMNIYLYDNKLFTVNKSPYTSPEVGSISTYNLNNHTSVNTILNKNVGTGAGIDDSLLYFGFGYGIGSFNLNTLLIADSVVVSDPGSAVFMYVTSATVDTLNNLIYMNVGDYATPGTCFVATITGDSVTSFSTGISADAVAVDYRAYPAGIENRRGESLILTLSPNPVSDILTVKLNTSEVIREIMVSDLTRRIVIQNSFNYPTNLATIPVNILACGVYAITVKTDTGSVFGKFVKE